MKELIPTPMSQVTQHTREVPCKVIQKLSRPNLACFYFLVLPDLAYFLSLYSVNPLTTLGFLMKSMYDNAQGDVFMEVQGSQSKKD